MKDKQSHIVDLHTHVFPERMFHAVWRFFEQNDWGVHQQQAARVARTLSDHGVGRAVALSYPHKAGVAASLNHFMASLGERFEIFLPFASVHVDDDDLHQYVDRALASPQLYGFKFQPLVQQFDINHPRLDYLYEACLEADFPLLMHVGTAPVANQFVGHEHFARLMGRYPGLRVCVAHMGAFQFDAFLGMLDHHPGMVLDSAMINTRTDLFDTTWRGDDQLLARHADRVCFGSDWPNVPYSYQEALDSVSRFPWAPGSEAGVLGENALRFLKLT